MAKKSKKNFPTYEEKHEMVVRGVTDNLDKLYNLGAQLEEIRLERQRISERIKRLFSSKESKVKDGKLDKKMTVQNIVDQPRMMSTSHFVKIIRDVVFKDIFPGGYYNDQRGLESEYIDDAARNLLLNLPMGVTKSAYPQPLIYMDYFIQPGSSYSDMTVDKYYWADGREINVNEEYRELVVGERTKEGIFRGYVMDPTKSMRGKPYFDK